MEHQTRLAKELCDRVKPMPGEMLSGKEDDALAEEEAADKLDDESVTLEDAVVCWDGTHVSWLREVFLKLPYVEDYKNFGCRLGCWRCCSAWEFIKDPCCII